MSGTFEDIDVPPTLISFAVSTAKADRIVSTEFKGAEQPVYLMTPRYYRRNGLPDFDSVQAVLEQMESLIRQRPGAVLPGRWAPAAWRKASSR